MARCGRRASCDIVWAAAWTQIACPVGHVPSATSELIQWIIDQDPFRGDALCGGDGCAPAPRKQRKGENGVRG